MKTILLVIIYLLINLPSQGQDSPRRLLGSFVYDNKVFTYNFAVEGSDTYSLNISTSDENQPKQAKSKANSVSNSISTTSNSATPSGETVTKIDSVVSRIKNDTIVDAKSVFYGKTKEIFETIFIEQMKKKNFIKTGDTTLTERGQELFYKIEARLDFLNDEPLTAYMILKRNRVVSILKNNSSKYYDGTLSQLLLPSRVDHVSIETEEGAMKNISVKLTRDKEAGESDENRDPRKGIEFKNRYPISISGKFDPEKFADIDLYCINCGGVRGLSRALRLSDLINMNILFETDKEDYSPANGVIPLSPEFPIRELKKEQRSKIFEVAAFSDLLGLNNDQPNGLIQIECKRRININTQHKVHFWRTLGGIFKSKEEKQEQSFSNVDLDDYEGSKLIKKGKREDVYYLYYRPDRIKQSDDLEKFYTKKNSLLKEITRIDSSLSDTTNKITRLKKLQSKDSLYAAVAKLQLQKETVIKYDSIVVRKKDYDYDFFNWFGNIEPRLLFAKLEDKLRYTPTDPTTNSNQYNISHSNLYRYQLTSLGANLNVLKVGYPQLKFNWQVLNVGAYWQRNQVNNLIVGGSGEQDTIRTINSVYFQFGTQVRFLPDGRWGASFSIDYVKPTIWNANVKLSSTGFSYKNAATPAKVHPCGVGFSKPTRLLMRKCRF